VLRNRSRSPSLLLPTSKLPQVQRHLENSTARLFCDAATLLNAEHPLLLVRDIKTAGCQGFDAKSLAAQRELHHHGRGGGQQGADDDAADHHGPEEEDGFARRGHARQAPMERGALACSTIQPVGGLKPLVKRPGGCPTQFVLHEAIVGVPAADSERSGNVTDRELLAGDAFSETPATHDQPWSGSRPAPVRS
jgi:hypothetical protein